MGDWIASRPKLAGTDSSFPRQWPLRDKQYRWLMDGWAVTVNYWAIKQQYWQQKRKYNVTDSFVLESYWLRCHPIFWHQIMAHKWKSMNHQKSNKQSVGEATVKKQKSQKWQIHSPTLSQYITKQCVVLLKKTRPASNTWAQQTIIWLISNDTQMMKGKANPLNIKLFRHTACSWECSVLNKYVFYLKTKKQKSKQLVFNKWEDRWSFERV